MPNNCKTRLCKYVAALKHKKDYIFDSDEFRVSINSLDPIYHQRIYIIIIDYYFSQKPATAKKECKMIPYKGKSLNGKKRSLSTNILYNIDNMPKELQSLIVRYVHSLV